MFTLVTHRFMHNCICTVLLVTWLFCSLYGYSATLAAKLIIKLDCDCDGDLINCVSNVRLVVLTSTKSFFDFNEIWLVGKGR